MSERYDKLGDEPIGITAWGEIFRGMDHRADVEVGILQVHPYLRNNPNIWQMTRKMLRLTHGNLVVATDFEESKGWIITERHGASLKDKICSDNAPLDQTVARTVFSQLLQLLTFFDQHEFIHGDIAPDRIFLPYQSDRQFAKLAFSLGATADGMPTGMVLTRKKSKKYFAPEMLNPRFGTVSSKTDMYCLAFSMLELLVGPTFDQHFDTIHASSEDYWQSWHGNAESKIDIHRLLPNVDTDIATALTAMLHKDQALRPASAKEVLKLLDTSQNSSSEGSTTSHKTPEKSQQATKNSAAEWIGHAKEPYIAWPLASILLVTVVSLCSLVFAPIPFAWVAMDLYPDHAQLVTIDSKGEPIDLTNKNGKILLPTGKHVLRGTATGFDSMEKHVRITHDGKVFDVAENHAPLEAFHLLPTLLKFSFLSDMNEELDLWVDGELKPTKNNEAQLTYGNHEVFFRKDGFRPTLPEYLVLTENTTWKNTVNLEIFSTDKQINAELQCKNQREKTLKIIYAIHASFWKQASVESQNERKRTFDNYFTLSYADDLTHNDISRYLDECCSDTVNSIGKIVDSAFDSNEQTVSHWKALQKAMDTHELKDYISGKTQDEQDQLVVWQGMVLSQLGKHDDAEKLFQEIFSKRFDWSVRFGDAALRHEKYDKAIRYYTDALKFGINDTDKLAELYNKRGVARTKMDRYNSIAVDDFSDAIKRKENRSEFWLNRAESYGVLGEYAKAELDLDAAARLSLKDARLFYLRAEIQRKQAEASKDQSKLRDAVESYSQAIHLDENKVEAYEGRAKTYWELGDRKSANADTDKVKQLQEKELEK